MKHFKFSTKVREVLTPEELREITTRDLGEYHCKCSYRMSDGTFLKNITGIFLSDPSENACKTACEKECKNYTGFDAEGNEIRCSSSEYTYTFDEGSNGIGSGSCDSGSGSCGNGSGYCDECSCGCNGECNGSCSCGDECTCGSSDDKGYSTEGTD